MTIVTRLAVERFGRFTDETFPLQRVTVFEGPNESGKTTLFDALFVGLCRHRRNTRYLDLTRYGDYAKPHVELGPAAGRNAPLYDEDEYRNLYAIRAGDVQLELDGRASWVNQVKRRLFAGGIDPEEIRAALDAYTSDDGRTTVNRERARAHARRSEIAAQLRERQAKRDEILQAEESLRATREELAAIAARREKLSRELAEAEKELERERAVRRRRSLGERLDELTAVEALEKRRRALEAFTEDRRSELDDRVTRVEQDDRRLTELQATMQTTARRRSDCEQRIAGMQEKETERRTRAHAAESALERVAGHQPAHKTVVRWRMPVLAAACLIIAAAVVAAALLPAAALRTVAGVLGTGIGVALVFLARTSIAEPDSDAEARFVVSLRDQWMSSTGDSAPVERIETLDGMRGVLQGEARAYELHTEKLLSLREESSRLAAAIAGLENDIHTARASRDDRARAVAEWLESRGVHTRDEYVEKLNTCRSTTRELEARRGRLAAAGITELATERRECERKLAELDRQGVPSDGLADERFVARQRDVERLRDERERLTRAETELTGRQSGAAGQIRGSLEPLMQQIVKLKGELAAAERTLEDMRLDRQGAQLALRLLDGIEADNELRFEELSCGIAGLVGSALNSERQVSVTGLQTGAFSLTDAQGARRPVDHVSSGTRDAFLFLARLELARRHGGESGLLVLDEPFLAFDDARCDQMVLVLKRFLEDNPGWQVVLFTKEAMLAQRMATVCDALVHTLHP